MKKILSVVLFVVLPLLSMAQFAPPVGFPGSTAVYFDSPEIVAWASGCVVERGFININNPSLGLADYGDDGMATGKADGVSCVSLGDGGIATLTFQSPIRNGEGPDFAVFENATAWPFDTSLFLLELAFVEVSSDGRNYFRFPSYCNLSSEKQVGASTHVDPCLIHNLAGKYEVLYGTPFDLDDLPNNNFLDKNKVTHVRVIDVVGCIQPAYATYDSRGHVINDPWPTPYSSSGFDLDAVGVMYDLAHNDVQEIVQGNMLIYPNPAVNETFVTVEAAGLNAISVYDIQGRLVSQQSVVAVEGEQVRISTEAMNTGVYFVRVSNENNTQTAKLVVK